MKKQFLIIIGILFLLNSCKQTESKEIKESEEKQIVETKIETTELTSVADSYIDNDSLTEILLSELKNVALNSKFAIKKKPKQNRYADNLIDTIITRTFKKSNITSYKAVNKEILYNASIEDSDFELVDFIKVGTKKYVVEKSLATGIPTDILKIGNLEGTLEFSLKFELGILKKIEFEGYLD